MDNKSKKPSLVIDLDQTLISGEPTDELDFGLYKNKTKNFNFENMDDFYLIFERPHLQKFLTFIFKNFNVSIWTAASRAYALFIIDKIILKKKNRKVDYIFFSYHCSISKKLSNGKSKDISLLWTFYNAEGYKNGSTIILDDFKEDVYISQTDKCILVKPFEFTKNGSENDSFLIELIPKLNDICKAYKKGEIENIKRKVNEINKHNIKKYKL